MELNSPIPGENFTSDNRNYPWHRPPEITDMDKAIEYCMDAFTNMKRINSLLTMLKSGMTVSMLTDIFVTTGIGQGKWTPDFAILLAGPVSRIIKIVAETYEVKYKMGIEEGPMRTFEFVKARSEWQNNKLAPVATAKEQSLGYEQEPSPIPDTGMTQEPMDDMGGGFSARGGM